MDAYFSLFVALAYVAMFVVVLSLLALHLFLLPTKLRLRAPLADGAAKDEGVEGSKPERKADRGVNGAGGQPEK